MPAPEGRQLVDHGQIAVRVGRDVQHGIVLRAEAPEQHTRRQQRQQALQGGGGPRQAHPGGDPPLGAQQRQRGLHQRHDQRQHQRKHPQLRHHGCPLDVRAASSSALAASGGM